MSKLKKANNITSVTLVNNTAKTIDLTPGSGKRWTVLAGRQVNIDDVARVVNMVHYAEAAATNILCNIIKGNSLAATTTQTYPSANHSAIDEIGYPGSRIVVEGVEIIRSVWATGGASTGATDADGLHLQVLEEAI